MKEQTPITAEEVEEAKNFMLMPEHSTKSLPFLMALFAKQYAHAKVLEALEREFSEVVIFDSGELTKGTDYFKTELKPNYEN